jgi:DNA-binding NarL/FixJ family response regulator
VTQSNAHIASASPAQPRHFVNQRPPRRVLIVDDHPIMRQGLRSILEDQDDLALCGEAESSREARNAIRELNPDVVVVEFSLKQGDGIDLVRDIRAAHPHPVVA